MAVGALTGTRVGEGTGRTVGCAVGTTAGSAVGVSVGLGTGTDLGVVDGRGDGDSLGEADTVGSEVGWSATFPSETQIWPQNGAEERARTSPPDSPTKLNPISESATPPPTPIS